MVNSKSLNFQRSLVLIYYPRFKMSNLHESQSIPKPFLWSLGCVIVMSYLISKITSLVSKKAKRKEAAKKCWILTDVWSTHEMKVVEKTFRTHLSDMSLWNPTNSRSKKFIIHVEWIPLTFCEKQCVKNIEWERYASFLQRKRMIDL